MFDLPRKEKNGEQMQVPAALAIGLASCEAELLLLIQSG